MTAQPTTPMTAEEYLALDRASETKHEFYDGELVAMAGASYAHNLIAINTGANLYAQLDGGTCRVLPGDLRVSVRATNSFAYPDLTVVCGTPQFGYGSPDILLNPTVVIEVLSPSTECDDRGRKFQQYRTIEALREYLLIDQTAVHVEQFVRQANNRWLFSEAIGDKATLHLPTIDCTLALADLYRDVEVSDPSARKE